MKIDGIQLREGSVITNLTVASGDNFPANPAVGELFFRTHANEALRGLYLYVQNSWSRISNELSTVVPQGASFPANPVSGQLFYHDTNDENEGLFFYDDETSSWITASGGSNYVDLLPENNTWTGTNTFTQNVRASSVTGYESTTARWSLDMPATDGSFSVIPHDNTGVRKDSALTINRGTGQISIISSLSLNSSSDALLNVNLNSSVSGLRSGLVLKKDGNSVFSIVSAEHNLGASGANLVIFRFPDGNSTGIEALRINRADGSIAFSGAVSGITKAMVGLGNVDNTSDANKPISSATQAALDLKAPINNPTFTGTVNGITKAMVGLGNVDNTSDANKPISTATQTALDLKYDKTGGPISGNVDIVGSSRVVSGDLTSLYANDPLTFKSNVVNGRSFFHIVPNGTSTTAGYASYNSSDKANYGIIYTEMTNAAGQIIVGKTGSPAYLPFRLHVGGNIVLEVATTGVAAFTAIPTHPTPTAGDNSTQSATTAFVKAATDKTMPVGGGTDRAFFENDITVATSYTITTGKNAMSAGPITVANGVVVTVPNGSTWTII